MTNAQESVTRDTSDGHHVQSPFVEDLEHFLLFVLFGHKQHTLLRFTQHDLVGRHSSLALGNPVKVQFHTRSRPRAHLATRAGETRRAHILDADDEPFLHGFKAGFEQEFFHERVADLHIRPFRARIFAETGGCHCRAVDAIAARLCSDVDNGIADATRSPVENLVLFENP